VVICLALFLLFRGGGTTGTDLLRALTIAVCRCVFASQRKRRERGAAAQMRRHDHGNKCSKRAQQQPCRVTFQARTCAESSGGERPPRTRRRERDGPGFYHPQIGIRGTLSTPRTPRHPSCRAPCQPHALTPVFCRSFFLLERARAPVLSALRERESPHKAGACTKLSVLRRDRREAAGGVGARGSLFYR
jgi:hypothetical protein